jgi:hypothetical protein
MVVHSALKVGKKKVVTGWGAAGVILLVVIVFLWPTEEGETKQS